MDSLSFEWDGDSPRNNVPFIIRLKWRQNLNFISEYDYVNTCISSAYIYGGMKVLGLTKNGF